MTRDPNKCSWVKDLDFVDWFRGVAAIVLLVAGYLAQQSSGIGRIGIALVVVGGFGGIHLWLSIINRLGVNREAADSDSEVDRWVGDRKAERIRLLATELQERMGDPSAAYRDVTKQYVTAAFVALTLIGTLGPDKAASNLELVAAAYGLCGAIGVGLLLLERLSGWPHSRVGNRVISVGYHLMTWSLLFGVLCVVFSLKEVECFDIPTSNEQRIELSGISTESEEGINVELEGFDFSEVTDLTHAMDLEDDERQIRLLGAGELASARRALPMHMGSTGDVVVTLPDWHWACTYYQCCLGEMTNCARKKTTVELWDITVFPGHMKKLALLGYEEPAYLARHFNQAIADMTEYLSGFDEGRRVVESGVLALQARTWRRRLDLFGVKEKSDDMWTERDMIGNDNIHHYYGAEVSKIAVVGPERYRIPLGGNVGSGADKLEMGSDSLIKFLAPIPVTERDRILEKVAATDEGESVSLGTMHVGHVVARELAHPAIDDGTVWIVEVIGAKLNSKRTTG